MAVQPRVRYEKLSTEITLEAYLTSLGWTDITYRAGSQSDKTIEVPLISVVFAPTGVKELQIGKITGKDRLFNRPMVINAYMESEPRAETILDSIMDFMDETCIEIKDPGGTVIGTLQCNDSTTILGTVLPPILNNPKSMRWRGTVKGTFEAFYPG